MRAMAMTHAEDHSSGSAGMDARDMELEDTVTRRVKILLIRTKADRQEIAAHLGLHPSSFNRSLSEGSKQRRRWMMNDVARLGTYFKIDPGDLMAADEGRFLQAMAQAMDSVHGRKMAELQEEAERWHSAKGGAEGDSESDD